MAKYETQQSQLDALKKLGSFDISVSQSNLKLDSPVGDEEFSSQLKDVARNVTVINKTMVVDGDIYTESALSVRGTVNGNIKTKSDIGVGGLVNGDIEASNIDFNHAAVRGNAKAERDITLENHSVVIGDLDADKISIDGKVKGNIYAVNTVFFKSNALMVGSVVSGGINMEDGSRVNATITLTNKALTTIDDSEFDLEV